MQKYETHGLEILNKCLPPIKYKVMPGLGTISINQYGGSGDIKVTIGNSSSDAIEFMEFLNEHNKLYEFITAAFSGIGILSDTVNARPVPKYRWIIAHFDWYTHSSEDGMSWGNLDSLWVRKCARG